LCRLLGGRVRVPATAGLHHPGSLRIEADAYCSRVNAFGREYNAALALRPPAEQDPASRHMRRETGCPTQVMPPTLSWWS
jgi:hypothetical protein